MNMHGADKDEYEALSALVDGELGEARTRQLLARCGSDAELFERWSIYQVVGDALRSAELLAAHRQDFVGRMQLRLAAEPPPLRRSMRRASAWGRWVPALATAAAVAMLVWTLEPMDFGRPADRDTQAIAAAAAVDEIGSLEAYVLAHLDLAGGTAFEAPGAVAREVMSDGVSP